MVCLMRALSKFKVRIVNCKHHTDLASERLVLSMQIESKSANSDRITFEIFIQDKFSEFELSSVVTALKSANSVLPVPLFYWNIVSDTPGLLSGSCGTIARSVPTIFDHNLCEYLIIVGGDGCNPDGWLHRVRAMQRHLRLVAILSDAATAYIRTTKTRDKPMAAHWRDVSIIKEEGYFPSLTTCYAEMSDGIVTSAGSGFTTELIISFIAKFMGPYEIAELSRHLLVEAVRDNDMDQPGGESHFLNLIEPEIREAIRLMEENVTNPLLLSDISTRAGVSLRQLQRSFKGIFQKSPGQYYRRLRVKRARTMVTRSNLDMIEIALATGFASTETLSSTYKQEYSVSPAMDRANRQLNNGSTQITALPRMIT